MTIPENEQQIIQMMHLDKFEVQHPVPPETQLFEYVFTLNETRFTSEAIAEAVGSLTDQDILDLLRYPGRIKSDNNISGSYPESCAGEVKLSKAIKMSLEEKHPDTDQRIIELVKKNRDLFIK